MHNLKPIPAGCKRYGFRADGYCYSTTDNAKEWSSEVVFTCIATRETKAMVKFGNFVTSLLKQPVTHV